MTGLITNLFNAVTTLKSAADSNDDILKRVQLIIDRAAGLASSSESEETFEAR